MLDQYITMTNGHEISRLIIAELFMAFTKTGPIIPFCTVPVLSFDILPEDIDRF